MVLEGELRLRSSAGRRLLPVLMASFGVFTLIFAGMVGAQEITFNREGVVTMGTVLDKYSVPQTEGSGRDYYVSYVFGTERGERQEGVSAVAEAAYERLGHGDLVDVQYLPGTPATSRIAGSPEGGLAPVLIIGVVGGGLLIVGLAWAILARGSRGRSGRATRGRPDADGRYRFTRPSWRIWFDLLAAPIGAAAFGIFAFAVATGAIPGAGPERIAIAGLLGLFAALLTAASVIGFARGFNPNLLVVGPDGIWQPEMGHVAWSDIAEIRRESYLTPSGGSGLSSPVARHHRLGIVPRPEAGVQPSGALTAAHGLAQAYQGLIARHAPHLSADLGRLAPFGVDDHELSVPLDEVIACVKQYFPVSEAVVEASSAGMDQTVS
jgi:hypothetical protein